MAVEIGRKGWLGVGLEETPGTAVSPAKYLPYDTCNLRPIVEVIQDEAAKGVRERTWGATIARKRGEGDVAIKADVTNAPYLIIPALGSVTSTTAPGESSVYEHTITRKAGNPPKTLTLNFDDTVESRKFVYGTINTCEIAFSDDFVTISTAIISKTPVTGSGTRAITEETVMAFKDAKIGLGDTLSDAESNLTSAPLKVTAFTITINNNAEAHYLSGSNDVDHISMGQLEISGNYTLFFETTTERAAYEALTKRAMVLSITGASIGAAETEEIRIKIPKFHVTERSIDTAPAGFVTENPSFMAEYDSTNGYSIQTIITNQTSSY